jgi:effector-binding domain-containing protein
MNKKVLLAVILLVIIASCFIPVTEQTTTTIKSPFLSLYSLLTSPEKWEQWHPGFRKYTVADSNNKIVVHRDSDAFSLEHANVTLNVKRQANTFNISERDSNNTVNYTYSLLPVLDKMMNKTRISAEKSTSLGKYLVGMIWPDSLKDTHLYDLKAYMETDSLRYGYNIMDARVPASFIIEMKQKVLKGNKFSAANQMFSTLQQYLKVHGIKQLQPVMAQFLPKAKDSAQVNVGLFIDKEIKPDNTFSFVTMPKGGQLYAIKYNGRFDKRYKLYTAAKQYYADHSYHMIIQPFETYLNNKLPLSDTGRVNIQVNFSAVF